MNNTKRKINYDKQPDTKIKGIVWEGWKKISSKIEEILKVERIIVLDLYVGTYEEEIHNALKHLNSDVFIDTRDLFKDETKIKKMTSKFVTNDTLFGYVTTLSMNDYFDETKLSEAKSKISNAKGNVIVIGSGASLVVPHDACIIYVDMARWEHQLRMNKGLVKGLGLDNSKEAFASQHKRCYFNDWIVSDAHKDKLFDKISYWLDTHIKDNPKLIDNKTFMQGIDATVKRPFRIVPFFAPAPWGGQWMKNVFDLDKDTINYGWCFDCVPEENSLLFNISGKRQPESPTFVRTKTFFLRFFSGRIKPLARIS